MSAARPPEGARRRSPQGVGSPPAARPPEGACPAAPRGQTGFTLLEVLIALAIVAVALAATVRALGLSTTGTQAILERSLALQAARNHLAELHLRRTIPAPGIHQTPCAQGPLALVCESQARAADLAAAHPVTVRVRAREGGPVLAQLHGILTAPP